MSSSRRSALMPVASSVASGAQPAIAQKLLVAGQRGQFDLLPRRGRRRRASACRRRPAAAPRPSSARSAASCSALRRPARRSTSNAQFMPSAGSAPPAAPARAPPSARCGRAGRGSAPGRPRRAGRRAGWPRRRTSRWVCGTGSSGRAEKISPACVQRQQQALPGAFDGQPGRAARLACAPPACARPAGVCSSRRASLLAMVGRCRLSCAGCAQSKALILAISSSASTGLTT